MRADEESGRGSRELKLYPERRNEARELRSREIAAIVAIGPEGEIGRGGTLPWHIPEDLKHFKELTAGHTVIMGRNTWESLPRRPLPGRRNIVISRNPSYEAPGGEVRRSLIDALAATPIHDTPFIIGGAAIYGAALPYLSTLHITDVDMEVPDADTRFPTLKAEEWDETFTGEWQESRTGVRYRYRKLVRRNR